VAPSVAHIPWVTLKFLLTDVVFGHRKMTRALEQCSCTGAPATGQRATRANDLLHDRGDETLVVATAHRRL